MTKEFIPYEQALELKELGFDSKEFISCVFVDTDNIFFESNGFCPNSSIWAPTFSQAFRWFREKFEAYYTIEGSKKYGFAFFIYYENDDKDELKSKEYSTYKEAELECLKKLIEIVKQKDE